LESHRDIKDSPANLYLQSLIAFFKAIIDSDEGAEENLSVEKVFELINYGCSEIASASTVNLCEVLKYYVAVVLCVLIVMYTAGR